MRDIKVLGLIALAISTISVAPAIAEVVGTMTALQTRISGAGGKNLSVGAKISLGDQISSNSTGLGMIVFNDESSAKIGPNSKLTIDEFVYQPGSSKGKVAVNMKSGLVRFYGGQISKSGKMQVTTPHIVLGIRGGILDTEVNGSTTKSILRAGRMSCSVNGQSQTVTKPGFACISDGNTLKVELAKDEDMDLLDSQDKVAGNGVPGQKGNGIRTRSACIEGRNDAKGLCKSANGALPGLTGKPGRKRSPLQPLGSEKHKALTVNSPYETTCSTVFLEKKPGKSDSETTRTSAFAFVSPSTGTTTSFTITSPTLPAPSAVPGCP